MEVLILETVFELQSDILQNAIDKMENIMKSEIEKFEKEQEKYLDSLDDSHIHEIISNINSLKGIQNGLSI